MKIKIIRILSVFFALVVILTTSVISTQAINYPNDIKTACDAVLLVNMDTNLVVYEKAADEKRYPASTTKIMTYIVAVENIDDIENTRINIKKSVLDELENTGSSLANVADHIGESMSVIDLLYSMMVPSGNDAAMVLADYVGGGDIDEFVDMMNAKAEEIGCENTHFANPDGLHDDDHYTTARDLYKIAAYALKLPKFAEISDTAMYYCEGDDYPLITTNYLIDPNNGGEYYYMYAKGIKTGTTDQAGRCLVTTASADGYSYMAVLLHAPYEEGVSEEYGTFTDAASLFRWALTSLEMKSVASRQTPICEEKVNLAWGVDSVLLVPQTNFSCIVPSDIKDENLVIETEVPESIDAPLNTDTVVGKATIYYRDDSTGEKQLITQVNLVSSEKIERSGILFVIRVISTVFKSYWFLIVLGFIFLVLFIYYIAARIQSTRNRKKRKVKHYRNL
ncbi:MAG: D-alanyl-D-alanine carboxypeptidase [Ruminococcus sp.]|nr:D-alanyl-D-alanine carboxypeptidase [Ruminococcus sp.]